MILLLTAQSVANAQSLRGSSAAMREQQRIAQEHDFTYLNTSADVQRFVDLELLVPVPGNADYGLTRLSFPYARPEVRLFIERLASQYRAACGERLVVTSLTRPLNRQPRNASRRSVHPTGMALDLRVSSNASCRNWLNSALLSLEASGVINATRERNPPHFHVAVYPNPYRQHVARVAGSDAVQVADAYEATEAEYHVARGDSLWSIARRYATTVEMLQAANDLSTSRIYAGQTLRIPVNN